MHFIQNLNGIDRGHIKKFCKNKEKKNKSNKMNLQASLIFFGVVLMFFVNILFQSIKESDIFVLIYRN